MKYPRVACQASSRSGAWLPVVGCAPRVHGGESVVNDVTVPRVEAIELDRGIWHSVLRRRAGVTVKGIADLEKATMIENEVILVLYACLG